MLTVKEIVNRFEQFAPKDLAEDWDNVGLQVGSFSQSVKRVMTTLDVRPEVVAEAIEKKVDLIIAHHPLIFVKPSCINTDIPEHKMFADLLKHNITVYAAHTNLDVATGGLNDWLGQQIGIENTEIMSVTARHGYKKLAVFVPTDDEAVVREALVQAGAGNIGPNYQHCSYTLVGTGRFTPTAGAQPAIGSLNQEEAVKEAKIEVIFPESRTTQIEKALFASHPYEEPAYDIYTIDNYYDTFGLGRVGDLEKPISVKAFASQLKDIFGVAGLRLIAADTEKMIQRVAVCGGAAADYYPDALRLKADVYITGDVSFHKAQDMALAGLSVIDPGHHIESICKVRLKELLATWSEEYGWGIEVMQSELSTEPFQFIV